MNDRPFKRIADEHLIQMFRDTDENLLVFTLLENELRFRSSRRALWLWGRVAERLERLTGEKVDFNATINSLELKQSNDSSTLESQVGKETAPNQAVLKTQQDFFGPQDARAETYAPISRSDGELSGFLADKEPSDLEPHPIESKRRLSTNLGDETAINCIHCQCEIHFDRDTSYPRIERCENSECAGLILHFYSHGENQYYCSQGTEENYAGIISVDFGTSSIRVAVKSFAPEHEIANLLKIGAIVGATKDYEIDSAILILNNQQKNIYFGEEAYVRATKDPQSILVYETSPKKWISQVRDNERYTEEKTVSNIPQELLVSALLGYALRATAEQLCIEPDALLDYEIRVAHPVWASDLWNLIKLRYEQCLSQAVLLTPKIFQSITIAELSEAYSSTQNEIRLQSQLDVLEPVAAALQLFNNEDNSRQVCAVIDVGAGTTDYGLFLSLTPDTSAEEIKGKSFHRKFLPIASPRSINYAGDYIDGILIELIREKLLYYNPSMSNETSIRLLSLFSIDVRSFKEKLFVNGSAQFHNITLDLSQLEARPGIQTMVKEVARTFSEIINEAAQKIVQLYSLNSNYIRTVDLCFAGGGGQIPFLRNSIPRDIKVTDSLNIHVRFAERNRSKGLANSAERYGVALGGTEEFGSWPIVREGAEFLGPLDRWPRI